MMILSPAIKIPYEESFLIVPGRKNKDGWVAANVRALDMIGVFDYSKATVGYLTPNGKFYDKYDAKPLARAAGQLLIDSPDREVRPGEISYPR